MFTRDGTLFNCHSCEQVTITIYILNPGHFEIRTLNTFKKQLHRHQLDSALPSDVFFSAGHVGNEADRLVELPEAAFVDAVPFQEMVPQD